MLRLGPEIQAIAAANAPITSSPERTLDRPGIPNPSAYTVKACDAPDVSSSVESGTATEIASDPSRYMTKTTAAATNDGLQIVPRLALQVGDVHRLDLETRRRR